MSVDNLLTNSNNGFLDVDAKSVTTSSLNGPDVNTAIQFGASNVKTGQFVCPSGQTLGGYQTITITDPNITINSIVNLWFNDDNTVLILGVPVPGNPNFSAVASIGCRPQNGSLIVGASFPTGVNNPTVTFAYMVYRY